ncbi:hypothetical protein DFQ26_002018 [Actinomortierella ambigua]|nr:hypothetical protein DFQ26_002018 [Actinomortierella ambigua]
MNAATYSAFDQYADEHQGRSDVSEDFIMDLTADSSFASSLPGDIADLVLADHPSLPITFPELAELTQLIGGRSSFQDIRDLIYSTPINTNVRHFLYASVDGYADYFRSYAHQPLVRIIHTMLNDALRVLAMPEHMQVSNFALYDSRYCELVLVEYSSMYQSDMGRFVAERWRLSRAMKHAFDLTIKSPTP